MGAIAVFCLFATGRIFAGDLAGEILIAERNCVACHDAAANVKERLASRQSPRLGADGVRVTPQWLRAFLSDPQASKPGTLMPDLLQALPSVKKAEAIEALTHFLISLQNPSDDPGEELTTSEITAGKKLYHSLGCVVCHAPQELPETVAANTQEQAELASLQAESVPLGDLARKFTVRELSAFLQNPLLTRPSGRMPSLNLKEPEARLIAVYLLRNQVPTGSVVRLPGLKFEYYEAQFPELPEFDRIKPKTTGTVDTFSLKVAERKKDYGIRFRGGLEIKKSGGYTFYSRSDDGARLYLDNQLVVENGGVHGAQEASGRIYLSEGMHEIRVVYFQGNGGAELTVSWKGPGQGSKKEIPEMVLFHDAQRVRPLGDAPFVVDATQAARGRELFTKLNCAACHALDQPGQKAKHNLSQLSKKKAAGCLAENPPAGVPKFALTVGQRADLVAQLANASALAKPLSPEDQVRRTMTVLNCYACHQRDPQKGPAGLRREYFTTGITSELAADLGDEGRMPPHLNGLGSKLKSDWIRRVLWEGAAVRPYLATRMPQFGEVNVKGLATALEQADAVARPKTELLVDEAAAKMGHKLVGVGGLSCIQCHAFRGYPSLGVPAMDLSTISERLKPDWFHRYLLDPASLRPGTRMPSFWPDGKAARADILNGDPEKQITAIWSFLAKGKEAMIPDGMIHGKQELVADREAVIYRNFIEGAGSRAIGVGYPEKLNLAFDANETIIAQIWQGPFIDAAKHRTGRGEGFEKPLGYSLIKLPEGTPFAILDSGDSPWPKKTAQAAGYQFSGYTLDEKMRPSFAYAFHEIRIQDYPIPMSGPTDNFFRRSFTLRSDVPVANLYFRAARADKIESKSDGSFLIDGKLKVRFTDAKPFVRTTGGKRELLVPLSFNGAEARFVEDLTW